MLISTSEWVTVCAKTSRGQRGKGFLSTCSGVTVYRLFWFLPTSEDEWFKLVSAALMIRKIGKWFPIVLGAASVGVDASWVGEGFHPQRASAVEHLSERLSQV